MAHTGTGCFDRKGNFFKTARDATVSLGRIASRDRGSGSCLEFLVEEAGNVSEVDIARHVGLAQRTQQEEG